MTDQAGQDMLLLPPPHDSLSMLNANELAARRIPATRKQSVLATATATGVAAALLINRRFH